MTKKTVEIELPVIPREVAEAIDAVKDVYSHFNIIESLRYYGQSGKFIRDNNLAFLHEWCEEDVSTVREDLVIRALVNGYTVEQSPEEKVREYYGVLIGGCDRDAVRCTLDLLGIKIKGVNAPEEGDK